MKSLALGSLTFFDAVLLSLAVVLDLASDAFGTLVEVVLGRTALLGL